MNRSPMLYRAFRWTVFKAGDIRRLRSLPWVTWDTHQHRITYDEIMRDALPLLKIGDIVLHRDEGFLSNLFIGGAMIHAGIYVGDGWVIEAVSEGVVKRHALHIIHSDYAMILRPQIGDEDSVVRKQAAAVACAWAEKMIGLEYDPLFEFNASEERALIKAGQMHSAKLKMCCTEIPYVCYYDYLTALNVGRRRNIGLLTRMLSWVGLNAGERVVDADMYVTANFDLVWASRSLTPEWATSMGCPDNYIEKINRYKERANAKRT
jgi:hypothetical protein